MSMGHLDRRAFLRHGATLAAAGALAPTLGAVSAREAWARTRDVVAFPAGTTYERTILPIRKTPYTRFRQGAGWPLLVREDLGAAGKRNREQRRVALTSILHLTDVQVPDAQSPARVEWMARYEGDFRAAWRPHEAVVNHISEAAIRRAKNVGRGPVTGRRYDFAINTGDNIDNMQLNELQWFLTLMNGGQLTPNSGHPAGYQGVQRYFRLNHPLWLQQFPDGFDDFYYRPDSPPSGYREDQYKRLHGYPTLDGFLAAAIQPFLAEGLGMPWYSLYGNHDGLVQGNAPRSDFFQAMATGQGIPIPGLPDNTGPKVVGFPPGYAWTPEGANAFFADLLMGRVSPQTLLSAPLDIVPADVNRRLIGPREYVRTHLRWPTGTPNGHGFTEDNVGDGDLDTTLYYTFRPVPGAPVLGISLDSTNRLGGSAGSIGRTQLAWLERQLQAVSSRYVDPSGRPVRNQAATDHVVLLFSHHNLATMTNAGPSPDDPQRVLGAELKAVLQRYPNVVAFINGHSHINKVWSHPDASGRTGGFWEIATSAQLDYPMQTRVIELVDNRDETLSLFCSIVDGAGPADPRTVYGQPGGSYDLLELAGYGRELAYNDWREHEGRNPFDHRVGAPQDRNVELLVAAPFRLDTSGPPERVLQTLPPQAVAAGRRP